MMRCKLFQSKCDAHKQFPGLQNVRTRVDKFNENPTLNMLHLREKLRKTLRKG